MATDAAGWQTGNPTTSAREWLEAAERALREKEDEAREYAACSKDSYTSGFARGVEEARIEVQRIIAWLGRTTDTKAAGLP